MPQAQRRRHFGMPVIQWFDSQRRCRFAARPPSVTAALAGLLVVLSAGCGGTQGSATSVTRSYEEAILSRDGDALCATFTLKLREVIGEQLAREQSVDAAGTRFDCGSFYHVRIGYPHENVEKQFVTGTLLSVGSSRQVRREGVLYVKVPAKLRFDYVYTGYSTSHRRGAKGTTTFEDAVWLAKSKDGRWGVVKPSLALVAASAPTVLDEAYTVAHVNAPPPDPDYSMNRAERTAWEAADYKASFRRRVRHSPLTCHGERVSVEDPLRDSVTYPTGSALHPVAALDGNDVERVTIQAAGHSICVAVTFRKKPTGHLSIGFTPRLPRTFFPEFIVELDPTLGARGGGLTVGYRYFRGGQQLSQKAVKEISMYRSTVAFVAAAGVARPPSPPISPRRLTDFYWRLRTSAPTGSDQVPNQPRGGYLMIRQSDGHAVTPGSG